MKKHKEKKIKKLHKKYLNNVIKGISQKVASTPIFKDILFLAIKSGPNQYQMPRCAHYTTRVQR